MTFQSCPRNGRECVRDHGSSMQQPTPWQSARQNPSPLGPLSPPTYRHRRLLRARRERPRCRHTAEQSDELAPPKRVRPDQKCVDPSLHQVRKGYIDLAIAARGENVNLPPNGGTRLPCLCDLKFSIPTIRIDEHGKAYLW